MAVNASTVALGTLGLAAIAVTVMWQFFRPVVILPALGLFWTAQIMTGARFARGFWLHCKDYDWFFFSQDKGCWLSRLFAAFIVLSTPSIIGLVLARGLGVG